MIEAANFEPGALLITRTFPPITRHTLALYAGGSGDHNPVHVDLDFAHAAGFPDVFVFGMLVMAYLARTLGEVVPQSALRAYEVRFVSITPVGAKITCACHAGEVFMQAGEQRVRIALTAMDKDGAVKLQGSAVAAASGI